MTIIVRSNEPVVTEPAAPAAEKPAPEPKDPGQKEASEPDPEEPEGGESKETETGGEEPSDVEIKTDKKDDPKQPGGFQRKINKLTARYAEERSHREALEARLAQIERAGGPKPDASTKAPDLAGKPDLEQFAADGKTNADYLEALAEWKADQKVEQKLKVRDEKLSREKIESEQADRLKGHYAREKSFAEKTDDYAEALEEVEGFKSASPALSTLLVDSENGPELMYELAKNKEEYERINKLAPLAAARELGKFESRIAKAASGEVHPPNKLTKAPKPLEPVAAGGKGSVRKSMYDPDVSQEDFERLYKESVKRRQAS